MKAKFHPGVAALLALIAIVRTPEARGLEVISWVPPYAIAACQGAVTANFGAYDARDGLTRVGLQFWVPRADGTLKYADHEWYVPTDSDVVWWRNWGQANGIKILLTVYNNTGKWDWNLARSAFGPNRAAFVNALVGEMDRLGLDGIDLDLEGTGNLDGDRTAFNQFVQALSAQVHQRGKVLTVDSFHYIWNAPNQSWWPDWVGAVNQIHAMGYDDLYEGGTGYHKYSFQQNTAVNAGHPASALLVGFPSWVDSWGVTSGRGTTALAHVREARYDLAAPSGIAIWDLQMSAAGWQASELWAEIAALKAIPYVDGNRAPVAQNQSVGTPKDTAVAIVLSGSDPDGDPLSYHVATLPSHGALTGTAPNLTFTPASGYVGADAFTFTVSDGELASGVATVSITVTAGAGALPTGWNTADIGAASPAGSAAYDAGTAKFTVAGSGVGLTGTADSFRYVWQTMSGDGEIRARIVAFSGSPAGALAGVTIRAGTAAGSAHHFLGRRNDGTIVWVRRNSTGRSTSLSTGGTAGIPCWVRLVRAGTTITAYKSVDGIAWARVNNAKITMATDVTVGLAVSSSSNGSLASGWFDAVAVVP